MSSYDRDFNHQAEMFSDDEYFDALDELIADEAGFAEALSQYARNGRLGEKQFIQAINELIQGLEVNASDRIEMRREERREA